MSRTVPERGRLTDALVAHFEGATLLSTPGIAFGDGRAPTGVGWSGQPGEGEFVASVVLSTGQAIPGPAPDTIRSAHTTWRCLYGLRSVGGSRTQADFTGDRARETFLTFPETELELGETWKVQQLKFERLAAVREQKIGDTWQYVIDDLAEIWITRSAR